MSDPNTVIDRLFEVMIARAPRRPSKPVEKVPDCQRVVLQFGRLRQRWKKREPIPRDVQAFAQVLKEHGVYIFEVGPGHIECQAAHSEW
jgi:hypothetical protein